MLSHFHVLVIICRYRLLALLLESILRVGKRKSSHIVNIYREANIRSQLEEAIQARHTVIAT
jgi:hypothetical protein